MNATALPSTSRWAADGDDDRALSEVLVGIDGTYPAGEALGWAARVARSSGASLTAVHAWPAGPGTTAAGVERVITRRQRALRRWCQPATDAGVDVRTVIGAGELSDVLASTVSGGPAGRALVVLGRAAPGSGIGHDDDHQCDAVARGSCVPLAVVPSPGAGRSLGRVVLGLHGSDSAHAAAVWLASVAGPLELDVHAVTAFEPIVEWVPRTDEASAWTRIRAELDGPWIEPLRRRGLSCSTHVVEGINVGAALTHHARRCHADAIVVGLAGRAGHRRRHAATELLERCHLPVILVAAEAVADAVASGS